MTRIEQDPDSLARMDAWFDVPWRRGACAVGFARESAGRDRTAAIVDRAAYFLRRVERLAATSPDDLPGYLYARAHALRYSISRHAVMGRRTGPFLVAGLDCAAKWIARSSGGGSVYNVYLQAATVHAVTRGWMDVGDVERRMERWRLRDAFPTIPLEKHAVHAFRDAWRAGKCSRAYTLIQS